MSENPMRSVQRRSLLAGLLFSVCTAKHSALYANAAMRYRVDPLQSRARFVVRVPAVGEVICEFAAITGEIDLDFDGLEGAAHIQIDTQSLRMLQYPFAWLARSREFLDTARFPMASFVTRDIQFLDGKAVTATGLLTIKQLPRRERFDIQKLEHHPASALEPAKLIVEVVRQVSRRQFEINGLPGVIDDMVRVELRLTALAIPG
ncbi:MAG: YceI family protein [Betaproteobacteria bacterium]|nr:YceI family protein [Betaproteobacteria bacterium]